MGSWPCQSSLQEDGFPFLNVVRPDIGLAALVQLLPGLLLPVLYSALMDAFPLWVGPFVWQLGSYIDLPGGPVTSSISEYLISLSLPLAGTCG